MGSRLMYIFICVSKCNQSATCNYFCQFFGYLSTEAHMLYDFKVILRFGI